MGKCWSNFNSTLFKKRKKIKLMIIGLNKAGKTTLVKYLLRDLSDNTLPTIGFACHNLKRYKNFDIQLYDLGGGDNIRKIWNNYYGLVHGIIFVIDSVAADRLNNVKECLNEAIGHTKVSGKPILIMANKQDLDGALDEMEIYKDLDLKNLINRYQCPTKMEACSVINKWGHKVKNSKVIDEGYYWLINHIIKNWSRLQARVDKETVEQIKIEKEIMEKRFQKYRLKNELEDSKLDSQEGNIVKQILSKALSRSLATVRSITSQDSISAYSASQADQRVTETIENGVTSQAKFDQMFDKNVISIEESKSLLEKIQNSMQVKIKDNQTDYLSKSGHFVCNKSRSKSVKNLLLRQNKIIPMPSSIHSRPRSR